MALLKKDGLIKMKYIGGKIATRKLTRLNENHAPRIKAEAVGGRTGEEKSFLPSLGGGASPLVADLPE